MRITVGLYYNGARYLAAWLGRWTSADPIGLQAGLNLYQYCRGSPINYVDPSGTQEHPPPAPPGYEMPRRIPLNRAAAPSTEPLDDPDHIRKLQGIGVIERGDVKSFFQGMWNGTGGWATDQTFTIDPEHEGGAIFGEHFAQNLAFEGAGKLVSWGLKGAGSLLRGADEAAEAAHLAKGEAAAGEALDAEELLRKFASAEHTASSAETLRRIESGATKVVLNPALPEKIAGTTATSRIIEINPWKRIEEAIPTIAHEGQHAQDIAAKVIPSPTANVPIAERIFAELRAYTAGGEFAAKNGLTGTRAYSAISGKGPRELAEHIAHGMDEVAEVTKFHIDQAVGWFSRGSMR